MATDTPSALASSDTASSSGITPSSNGLRLKRVLASQASQALYSSSGPPTPTPNNITPRPKKPRTEPPSSPVTVRKVQPNPEPKRKPREALANRKTSDVPNPPSKPTPKTRGKAVDTKTKGKAVDPKAKGKAVDTKGKGKAVDNPPKAPPKNPKPINYNPMPGPSTPKKIVQGTLKIFANHSGQDTLRDTAPNSQQSMMHSFKVTEVSSSPVLNTRGFPNNPTFPTVRMPNIQQSQAADKQPPPPLKLSQAIQSDNEEISTDTPNTRYTMSVGGQILQGCQTNWTYQHWKSVVQNKAPSINEDYWYTLIYSTGKLGDRIIAMESDYMKLVSNILKFSSDAEFALEAWGHTEVNPTNPGSIFFFH